jgi:hypothetical protein
MALLRWAQGRLYSLSVGAAFSAGVALLDSQRAADQSVLQIRSFTATSSSSCCWCGWCTG